MPAKKDNYKDINIRFNMKDKQQRATYNWIMKQKKSSDRSLGYWCREALARLKTIHETQDISHKIT